MGLRFPVFATSGLVNNSTATATLSGTANKVTYITQLGIEPGSVTTAAPAIGTLTGAGGGTSTYTLTVPVASADPFAGSLVVNFVPPLAATAVGGNVVLTLPATGAGGTNAQAVLVGYQE